MAEIKSGATSDKLTIDPTSKAARVTLYDSSGAEIAVRPSGSYMAPLARGRFSGALAAGSPFWAVRNGATKTLYIRRLYVVLTFDGTAAASTLQVELRRHSAATHSTGTASTPQPKRTSYSASTVADMRYRVDGTKLTDTSVVYDTNPLVELSLPRGVTGGVAVCDVDLTNALETYDCIEVPVNGGLTLWNVTATVVGDGVHGFVEWDEA